MIKISELIGLEKPLVLASKSPRRRNLMKQLGFEFSVQPSDIDEEAINILTPREYATKLAESKALDIAQKQNGSAIVIGADTIVVLGGKIINKPSDENEAFEMLSTLSDNTHTVYTGIAIVDSGSKQMTSDCQATDVTFRRLEDDEINSYIRTGSPMDKAGAYGIQDDFGAVFVSHIDGCYYNIVGLPLELLYQRLKGFLSE